MSGKIRLIRYTVFALFFFTAQAVSFAQISSTPNRIPISLEEWNETWGEMIESAQQIFTPAVTGGFEVNPGIDTCNELQQAHNFWLGWNAQLRRYHGFISERLGNLRRSISLDRGGSYPNQLDRAERDLAVQEDVDWISFGLIPVDERLPGRVESLRRLIARIHAAIQTYRNLLRNHYPNLVDIGQNMYDSIQQRASDLGCELQG